MKKSKLTLQVIYKTPFRTDRDGDFDRLDFYFQSQSKWSVLLKNMFLFEFESG